MIINPQRCLHLLQVRCFSREYRQQRQQIRLFCPPTSGPIRNRTAKFWPVTSADHSDSCEYAAQMRNGALTATIAGACTTAVCSLLAASHPWILEPAAAELCRGRSSVSEPFAVLLSIRNSIGSKPCPFICCAEALKLETDAPAPRLQRTRVNVSSMRAF